MPDSGPAPVRWGIMSAAGIARKEFLPGLRAAGGTAEAVAARDPDRAAKFAAEQGINRTVPDYQALIGDPAVDAVYLPLPNSLHADWTIAALRAGKPVLCEKPLGGTLADTERVLAAARETGTLLWEAFVFPFQDQMERIRGLLADGVIGELREIQSGFHFLLADPADIRLRRGLDGGALNDIGCYPVRLARLLFAAEHEAAWAAAVTGGDGVDVDTQGVLGFPDSRRLLLSCGFRRSLDRFARLLGSRRPDPHHQPVPPGTGGHVHRVRRGPARGDPFSTGHRTGLHRGDPAHPRGAPRHRTATVPRGQHRAGQRPRPARPAGERHGAGLTGQAERRGTLGQASTGRRGDMRRVTPKSSRRWPGSGPAPWTGSRRCAATSTASSDSAELVGADDEHDPEGATLAFERAQLAACWSQARQHLAELDQALARLAAGQYGTLRALRQPDRRGPAGRPPGRPHLHHLRQRGIGQRTG